MATKTEIKPTNALVTKAQKWKGTYKDFLGELTGKERSTARKAWRSVHGAHTAEVKK